ncbi:hypothetical protein DFH27DRAFT_33695 [Peziza echinospora]|nr:hypothetical protein DFH27DRAFT_33695 [Peziza echinospora]
MPPSYQPLNTYHDDRRIYHHSNSQRSNLGAPPGPLVQLKDSHHQNQNEMKWMCPVRNFYNSHGVSEYESSSPESCNGNDTSAVTYYHHHQAPSNDGQYYMISPSPEPPTIACAVSAANIALRLAVQRDVSHYNTQRDVSHYHTVENSPPPFHSPSPTTTDYIHSTQVIELDMEIEIVSSNDKQFVCAYPGCAKRFRRQEHLRRHEKSHTGVKDYKCDVEACGRLFSRSDNLKYHRKTHMKVTGRNVYVPGLK